jgi:hypothetical protein
LERCELPPPDLLSLTNTPDVLLASTKEAMLPIPPAQPEDAEDRQHEEANLPSLMK